MAYTRKTEKNDRRSRITGLVLTVSVHVAALALVSFSGLKYIYPPPQEQSMLIDFSEEAEMQVQEMMGRAPQAEEVDRSRPVELAQKSESPEVSERENLTTETKTDDFGDVETPDPKPEKPIDRRALFRTADNKTKKDTLAMQTADKVSDALKAGHAQGNTKVGETSGEPNAKLAGRSVNGTLPRPSYSVQKAGTVVVKIWVDNYGNVQKAVAGEEGTTVTDKTLWQAARKAALGAHFNMSADAPVLQEGTITYIFKLN